MGSFKTIINNTMLPLCHVRNHANQSAAEQLSCANTEIKIYILIAIKLKYQHKHLDDHKVCMKMGGSDIFENFISMT